MAATTAKAPAAQAPAQHAADVLAAHIRTTNEALATLGANCGYGGPAVWDTLQRLGANLADLQAQYEYLQAHPRP
jgi:hypothetical protein